MLSALQKYNIVKYSTPSKVYFIFFFKQRVDYSLRKMKGTYSEEI